MSRPAQKLAKVCGLLSSPYPGERANAAALATALLADFRMTWADLVERGLAAPPKSVKRRARRQKQPATRTATETPAAAQAFVEQHAGAMTPWERSFLLAMAKWRGRLSEKQLAVVDRLGQKLDVPTDQMRAMFGGKAEAA